jgi:hypothetical protein
MKTFEAAQKQSTPVTPMRALCSFDRLTMAATASASTDAAARLA